MSLGSHSKRDIERVRRVAMKRLKKAGEALHGRSAPESGDEDAVHTARKRIKEARALLRLVRAGLGGKRFRQDNSALRDAARPLSAVRDATAVIDALDALQKNPGTAMDDSAFQTLKTALQRRRAETLDRQGALVDSFAESVAAVEKVRRHNRRWRLDGRTGRLLASGLRRAYRKGYLARIKALDQPTDENLHEWRKRVKDLRYPLELLEPWWPSAMRESARTAKTLSDLLGEDHDLLLLRDLLARELRETLDGETVQAILQSIERRREDLQQAAWALGEQLFAGQGKNDARGESVRALLDAAGSNREMDAIIRR